MYMSNDTTEGESCGYVLKMTVFIKLEPSKITRKNSVQYYFKLSIAHVWGIGTGVVKTFKTQYRWWRTMLYMYHRKAPGSGLSPVLAHRDVKLDVAAIAFDL